MLAEFLSEREKEVVDIRMTLFNEEYILKTYLESEKQEAEKRGSEFHMEHDRLGIEF